MANTIFSEQEIQQLRAETAGTAHKIHFNNAGSSLPPDVVVDTVINYLREEAISGGYETEFKYKKELEHTYALIAQLISAKPDEIAIVENASTAWSSAFYAIDFKAGDEVITTEMEYVTNLIAFANAEKRSGISIKVIANNAHGNFPLNDLEQAITPQTKLIAVTQIPSTAGGIIPIVEIGKIARKHNILYLVDACQSAGQLPLDVEEIGCDMLSVTGRKYLRAPRGTGFLYVRKEIQNQLNPIFMDGYTADLLNQHEFKVRNDARRFELYENSRALVLGLGKAVEYALNISIDKIWQRIQFLATLLRQQLKNIDGITVHDFGDEQCGIVTFSINGVESVLVKTKLAEKNINVSVGKAASTLIYMDKNHLVSIVRASVHYYNTEEEVGVLCRELGALVK
jgi:selenocysteine lyase/cysteine desulfurase